MFEVKEKPSGSVKTGQFWTIINIVGASRVAGGGIGKYCKRISFGNTFFQIAKRRCKDFWFHYLPCHYFRNVYWI